jgi:hypothetical protein
MKIRSGFVLISLNERWAPLSRVIALGSLYLDNFGTKIRQCLTSPRARQNARQFNDF